MASLTVQQKQELAARLLELVPYGPEIRREDVPADLEHVFSKLRERVREVLVELYCAEFSDAELESQLNYYESPRGREVLASRARIDARFREAWPEIGEILAEGSGDASGLLNDLKDTAPRRQPPSVRLKRKRNEVDTCLFCMTAVEDVDLVKGPSGMAICARCVQLCIEELGGRRDDA